MIKKLKNEPMNCENLEELFRSWQKEQEEEIDEIGRYINEKLGTSCIGEMLSLIHI